MLFTKLNKRLCEAACSLLNFIMQTINNNRVIFQSLLVYTITYFTAPFQHKYHSVSFFIKPFNFHTFFPVLFYHFIIKLSKPFFNFILYFKKISQYSFKQIR